MAEDPVTGNYLRVRGEYERWIMAISFAMALPPRARRIPISAEHLMDYYGTTSACAENTHTKFWKTMHHRNYLRVRGEYNWRDATLSILGELPPRARRILILLSLCDVVVGTTSACAENTSRFSSKRHQCWNYLRVRGEYPK